MSLLSRTETTDRTVSRPVRQYTATGALAVWAAAALPMGLLAWVVAPALAGPHATVGRFLVTLVAALTAGLIWQFVLVLVLVAGEQRSLRWRVLRDVLWLGPPTNRRGWWWLVPALVGFAAVQFLPLGLHGPSTHDFGRMLQSTDGHELFRGNWALFGLTLVLLAFTTVLGEELLFRGLLLPRMRGAFGRADWIANAVLFGLYHLHQPWSIPSSILAGAVFAYPTRRAGSAWIGIIAHSAQSVFLGALVLGLVLR
jgi:membrane protease YdiL (CAAX protease family)